jgi:hypothetical protein
VPTTPSGELDLARLRSLATKKPRTKAGQVRQAWPEIRNLLAVGHTLKDVCTWVNEIGIQISYTRLSDYVNQLRRAERENPDAGRLTATARPTTLLTSASVDSGRVEDRPGTHDPVPIETSGATEAPDPLANIRRELERKRNSGFHYDPFPDKRTSEPAKADGTLKRPEAPKPHDPLANVRRSMEKQKRTTFDYRPELADPKELI